MNRLFGNSMAIQKAREFAEKAAEVNSPVLILGPSGVGKEVMARAIHESSARAHKPFIAINCASLTEQLMESELFGHERGAFTGAMATKLGKFELANGGTLFLDEVGDISTALQAKLLRVLQEREYSRVGGVKLLKTDVRVIAATNQPIREMIHRGTFREDLFFRLNVLKIDMPRLVDRKEDIAVLLDLFWTKFSDEFGKRLVLSSEARDKLLHYSYPGNVRELQNVVERLFVLVENNASACPEALPSEINEFVPEPTPPTPPAVSLASLGEGGLNGYLDAMDERIIREAMAATGDNQVKAGKLLKTSRGSLQYKLKKYGLIQEMGGMQEKAA